MSDVEWVETTGKTVEEAKEVALDRLGVDEQDAEFEVLEEPRSGLFGRTRGVGRVRARVLPRPPRAKVERRRRPKGGQTDATGSDKGRGESSAGRSSASRSSGSRGRASTTSDERSGEGERRVPEPKKERGVMDETAQCEAVTAFLDGLVAAMGLEVKAHAEMDGDVLRAELDGSEVGLLIGPKIGTLDAIQEITRSVLQRHADGQEYAKVVLDVGGVREMRRSALAAFVDDAAKRVLADGSEVVFEVMSSPDRKVVHDTVAEIDGVESGSIGEDPRRRVVLRPA